MKMNKPSASIVRTGDGGFITVVLDGQPLTIRKADAPDNFDRALNAIKNEDWDGLFAAMNPVKSYASQIANVVVEKGAVKYKGEVLHGVVVDRIVDFANQALPYEPLCRFIEKLMLNPSRRAIDELYKFLEHKQMPITDNGNFLAYKGVQSDYYSKTAGSKEKVIKGKVNDAGKIFNGIGEEIEVERNYVCDDADVACSSGLHAGSYSYASTFGPVLMVVEINPKDVVSIPKDCDCQKLRTCAYTVVDEITEPMTKNLVKSRVKDANPSSTGGVDVDAESISYIFKDSSFLNSFKWEVEDLVDEYGQPDPGDEGTLFLDMSSGEYEYYNVPRSVVTEWIKRCENGGSAGGYYNDYIRDQYTAY